jgi:hypothetical protein
VEFSVTAGAGSIIGAKVSTDTAGVATVGGWTLGPIAGTRNNRIIATTNSLPDSVGVVEFIASGTPGAATRLTIVTQSSTTAQSGTAFAIQPALRLQDVNANAVAQSGVVVTATTVSSTGVLSNATAITDASGLASFNGLTLAGIVGTYTLRFTVGGLLNADALPLSLTAGPPAFLIKLAGDSQYVSVGVAVPAPPSVRVTDGAGNPVPGASVVFTVAGGGGTVTGGATTTNGVGVAAVGSWRLGSSWQNTLTMSATALAGTLVSFLAFAFPPWSPVSVSGAQSAFATGVAYNRQRGKLILVHPNTGAWELSPNGGTWTQLATSAPGAGRVYVAVHEATQRLLAVSDQGAPSYWDYQTGTWALADVGQVPSARFYPALVYDSANARVLMYGGIINGGSSDPVADVYSWDGSRWTRLADAPAGPRAAHRMALDPSTGTIYVHGGAKIGNPFGGVAVRDTWTISPSGVWQPLPAILDRPLGAFAMAYDERRQSLVVAGGTTFSGVGYGLSTQVWELAAGQWRLSDAPTPVGARVFASMVFVPALNGILLYGNESNGGNDLWFYGYR